ncbi:MAG: hypothetical protein LBL21_02315 [Rickettsiales bacterium]|jgi:hypothetical protein|nr:hypothetical protein [Rickettsiales bacterium]
MILFYQDMEDYIQRWEELVRDNKQDSAEARDMIEYIGGFFHEYARDNAHIAKPAPGVEKEAFMDLETLERFVRFLGTFTFVPNAAGAAERFQRDFDAYRRAARAEQTESAEATPPPDNDGEGVLRAAMPGGTPPPNGNGFLFSGNNADGNFAEDAVRERPDYDAAKQWMHSDNNQYMLDREAASVYLDMGIITQAEHDRASPEETIKVLGRIPDLKGKRRIEFSERFIDRIANNENLFKLAPPMALADAYNGTKDRLASGRGDRSALILRRDRLAARMDELSEHFATNTGLHFADYTNFADVDEGYKYMFDARLADLDPVRDADKIRRIKANRRQLERFGRDYDRVYNIEDLVPEDAEKLEPGWNDLTERIARAEVSNGTLKLAAKYRFKGADGNQIPQFIDADGNPSADWTRGAKLDPEGRLNEVINLARQDVALRNVGKVGEEIGGDFLESELNYQIPFELFEIDTADKILSGAGEDPDRFTNPDKYKKFMDALREDGGEISDAGYQAALDAKVNQTAGFANRVKQKLEDGAKHAGKFFGGLFKPLQNIDKRAADRIDGAGAREAKRKKRVEFFVRILKGFGSALLVSAAITTIATAAAATAGISVAVGLAAIGITTGIVTSALQIHKWRKARRSAGKDDSIGAMLKDKRMMLTLGTTAIAAIAMIFGAAGFSQAAVALGYGAMAVGAGSNAVQTFKDAKASGMGIGESLAWTIANAAAVIGGGLAGRAAAKAGINAFNELNPENTIFQNKSTKTTTKIVSRDAYNQDALDNAKKIAESWYRDDLAELQRRVDLINDYNAHSGKPPIDPYRAIMLSADAGGQTFDNMALHTNGGGVEYSGGNHNVIDTAHWRAQYGVGADETGALRHLFDGGTLDPKGMDAAMKIDPMVSAHNEVGRVGFGNGPHDDGHLWRNSTDYNNVRGGGTGVKTFDTYENGPSVFHSETETIIDTETVFTPVDVPAGLGVFGIYSPKSEKHFDGLKKRIGALLDKVRGKKEPASKSGGIEDFGDPENYGRFISEIGKNTDERPDLILAMAGAPNDGRSEETDRPAYSDDPEISEFIKDLNLDDSAENPDLKNPFGEFEPGLGGGGEDSPVPAPEQPKPKSGKRKPKKEIFEDGIKNIKAVERVARRELGEGASDEDVRELTRQLELNIKYFRPSSGPKEI